MTNSALNLAGVDVRGVIKRERSHLACVCVYTFVCELIFGVWSGNLLDFALFDAFYVIFEIDLRSFISSCFVSIFVLCELSI